MLADRAEIGLPAALGTGEQGCIKRVALAAIPTLPRAHALSLLTS
jgi:hypothetical protein